MAENIKKKVVKTEGYKICFSFIIKLANAQTGNKPFSVFDFENKRKGISFSALN